MAPNFQGARFNPQGGGFTRGNNGNFANNYGAGYGRNNAQNYQAKPRKGCRKFQGKNGKNYVGGWFVDKYAGLIKVLVFPTKHSDTVHKSGNNKEWVSMAAKVTFKNSGSVQTLSALLNVATGLITIKDLNIGLSPNKNWCGYFFKKRN